MIKMISVLNILPILDFTSFESNWIENNKIFSEIKILICFENFVVVNFKGVIKV